MKTPVIINIGAVKPETSAKPISTTAKVAQAVTKLTHQKQPSMSQPTATTVNPLAQQ